MALKNDLSAEFKSDIEQYNGATDGQAYILLSETVKGDSPARIYRYDASSSATIDGENVLDAPNMATGGRFIKVPLQEFNSGLATVATSGLFADLLSKPTTLSGYGITDATSNARSAISLTTTGSGIATYNSTTGVLNVPTPTSGTGTVTSIVAGTGLSGGTITTSGTISMPNVGTAGTYGAVTTDAQGRVTSGKRMETYSGTTNGSGQYTVTFGTSYSVAPNIQANIINATDTQTSRITAISTTGFTILVRNRTDVIGLLPAYSNVSGASVDVLITEK